VHDRVGSVDMLALLCYILPQRFVSHMSSPGAWPGWIARLGLRRFERETGGSDPDVGGLLGAQERVEEERRRLEKWQRRFTQQERSVRS